MHVSRTLVVAEFFPDDALLLRWVDQVAGADRAGGDDLRGDVLQGAGDADVAAGGDEFLALLVSPIVCLAAE